MDLGTDNALTCPIHRLFESIRTHTCVGEAHNDLNVLLSENLMAITKPRKKRPPIKEEASIIPPKERKRKAPKPEPGEETGADVKKRRIQRNTVKNTPIGILNTVLESAADCFKSILTEAFLPSPRADNTTGTENSSLDSEPRKVVDEDAGGEEEDEARSAASNIEYEVVRDNNSLSPSSFSLGAPAQVRPVVLRRCRVQAMSPSSRDDVMTS